MNIKYLVAAVAVASPTLAFAQRGLDGVLVTIGGLLGTLIPILITIAVIVFFYGLIKYILAAGDAESKATGLKIMIGGLVALFVMVAVWGLVGILAETFDIRPGEGIQNVDRLVPPVR